MKISQIRDAFEEYSGKASEQSRQLALAGVAIIWILRVGTSTGDIKFSNALVLPLGGFALALGFDLFQYVYYTLLWGIINSVLRRRHKNDEKNVVIWPLVHCLPAILFYSKIALVVGSYIALLTYMAHFITVKA
ncbi:MAG: hypothetical protein H0X40_16380 [Chthoniobacterales bacterium]|nr:hypothetical protein [Chthoniobacterales bacterium]